MSNKKLNLHENYNNNTAPTIERHRQNGGVIVETITKGENSFKRYRAICECPLDAYWHKNLISYDEYQAGLRFHKAYYGVVLARRETYHPTSLDEALMEPSMSDKILDQAYKTLPSDELEPVINVCGHSMHIWHQSAFEKLRKGLDHLALQWHENAIEVTERNNEQRS